jgi:CheY-like chemotaxis protein
MAVKLLLVDDERDLLAFLSRLLTVAGCEIKSATNPADARRLAEDQAFDVLLTDIDMQGAATGISLARDLRAQQPGLRVIFMSGSPHGEELPPGDPFLAKPFTKENLLDALREVTSQR